MHGRQQGVDGLRADEAGAPGEPDAPRRFRRREGNHADQVVAVRVTQGAVRQDGNAETGRHHAEDGADRVAEPDIGLRAADLRAGAQHLTRL